MLTSKQLKESIVQKSILNISLLEKIVSNTIPENENCGIKHHGKVEVEFRFSSDESKDEVIQLHEVDAQVLNAVFTFIQHQVSEFSLEQLVGMIYGDFEKRHRDKIKITVAESVERLKKYRIHINAEQEFVRYKKLRGENATFKGRLLDIEEETCNGKNGKSTIVYRIRNPSPLMQYADTLNHVAKIDMRWYQLISKQTSFENVLMCERLLCRIVQAENPHNQMFKDDKDIMIFAWNKNTKRFSGVIGRNIEEFDKRKIERQLDTLKRFWSELEYEKLVSEFEWKEVPYNYGTLQYNKIYITRRKNND